MKFEGGMLLNRKLLFIILTIFFIDAQPVYSFDAPDTVVSPQERQSGRRKKIKKLMMPDKQCFQYSNNWRNPLEPRRHVLGAKLFFNKITCLRGLR